MWPNLHQKLNPPEDYSNKIAELEKKRELFNLIVQKDIDKYKSLAPPPPPAPVPSPAFMYKHMLPQAPAAPNYTDTISISSGGLNTMNPKIDIKNSGPPPPPKPSHYPTCHLNHTNTGSLVNTMSSYDYPSGLSNRFDSANKFAYTANSDEENLLKSIQESQEKLKLAQKLEKTTDIVDDIVLKVKILQSEMNKRSTALQIQNEIETLRKSRENLHLTHSCLDDPHHHMHHHHHELDLHRSRSIDRLHRSCSRERSHSRHRSPVSILKATEVIETRARPIRKRSVSFHRSATRLDDASFLSDNYYRKSNENLRADYTYVAPKVNSWNFNQCKHDHNVY